MDADDDEPRAAVLPRLPRRSTTAEHAAESLRRYIAEGRLAPGTQLREERLSTAFGISRNTVREAFRLLAQERLVEHALHRGVYVRTLTPDDVRELYRARRLLEPLGLGPAANSPACRAALLGTAERAAVRATAGDWAEVGSADIAFHRTLVSACESSHISWLFDQVLAELRLAFLRVPDLRALHEPYVEWNHRLAVLIDGLHADAARDELSKYLEVAERHLLDAVPWDRPAAGPGG